MLDVQKIHKQFSTWAADEFRPTTLMTSALSSLLIYTLQVIFVISFAALVFSGQLANQLPQVLGFILIGNAFLVGIITLLSSYPGSVGVAQDTPGAVLGVVTAAMVVALQTTGQSQTLATVVMMVVVTTMMTGTLFLVLGIFKLGGLARFLPYPVMGGFLAGTGWLLAKGGIGIMAGVPLGVEWLDTSILFHWLPGAILGIVVFVSVARVRHSFTLPLVLAIGAILFYVIASIMNISLTQLEAGGWLVGTIPSGSLSRFPLSAEILSQVNWMVLLEQIPNLAPASIIGVIALLLNSGGLELVIKKDIDLNRELVAAGVANLVAGTLGGLIGYQAISLSTLNHNMSGGKRLVGLITALLVGVTIFIGAAVVAYIPKMILGAVLVYLGVGLLVEWIYQAWFKFPRIDFAIILSILAVIIFSGFLNGILVGLVLAVILFVVNYSQVSIIKFALSGRDYHSRVSRDLREQQVLEARCNQIFILELQGFIFFGTANRIFDQVRSHIQNARAVRVVLLDFKLVSGLDSTGLLSFARMSQWLRDQKTILVLTGLTGRARDQFLRGGWHEQPDRLLFFSDLDHGVEWFENKILTETLKDEPTQHDLITELQAIMGRRANVSKLVAYMQRREYAAGDYLMRQDDEPDMIYFVESGRVTVQVESPGKPPIRRDTICSGRMVGELGFYLGVRRTAAVVVDEPSVIYSLSTQELARLEKTDPETANLFHRINLHLLSERAVQLVRILDALEL